MVINIATRVVAAIALYAAIAGCAGAKMPFGGGASASDPRCDIDAAAVCAQAATGPATINGQQADRTMREQLGSRTTTYTVPMRNQSGEVIANAACSFNSQNNSVVYASASTAGPLADKDLEYLRQVGVCK